MCNTFVVDEALWTIELNIECPKCENFFDYLETDEYKRGAFESLRHAQSDSEAEINVQCPECAADILVKSIVY